MGAYFKAALCVGFERTTNSFVPVVDVIEALPLKVKAATTSAGAESLLDGSEEKRGVCVDHFVNMNVSNMSNPYAPHNMAATPSPHYLYDFSYPKIQPRK